MISELRLLADLLEEAVADSECVVGDVIVTAGRPAAPSGEGQECQTRIYVFGAQVADENQAIPDACLVKSRWQMQYEIHSCYPEDWDDQTGSTNEAAAAACLYELMSLAWCALVEAKDTGYFCDCTFLELSPLIVQPRSGGAVSALGGVTMPYVCPVPAIESPTSP